MDLVEWWESGRCGLHSDFDLEMLGMSWLSMIVGRVVLCSAFEILRPNYIRLDD